MNDHQAKPLSDAPTELSVEPWGSFWFWYALYVLMWSGLSAASWFAGEIWLAAVCGLLAFVTAYLPFCSAYSPASDATNTQGRCHCSEPNQPNGSGL